MKYDAIMFDLDGTLLPMDFDVFTNGYLGLLYKYAAPRGYEKESFLRAMSKGVKAMTVNDGTKSNLEAFWRVFGREIGDMEKALADEEFFDAFYDAGFNEVKAFTGDNPAAADAVSLAREKAKTVILATSPLFPLNAVETRLKWINVAPESFDLITEYKGFTTSKPNPAYYLEIAEKMSLDPAKCLMIGNNVQEDIEGAEGAGMDTYLVTDWLINARKDLPDCKKGSFEDMLEFLKSI